MKIFLVCNSLGGGGAERVHVNLANGFAQRGHEVYLIADVNQPASYPVDEQVHVLPLCPQSTNKLKKWGGAVSMLRKNIKKYKPDVVIGNMALCSILSRLASLYLRTPVIFSNHHALQSEEYHIDRLTKICDSFLPRIMTATTLLTVADKEYMNKKYHYQKNVFVMPNPLTFIPIEVMCTCQNYILAAGRLNNWIYKGWDILIEATRVLAPILRNKGWKVQIVGGGSDNQRAVIDAMIHNNCVEDIVELLGFRTDMERLFQRASIFCLSSRSEGLPMVLIEAMSQGCAPVACENLGRTKEIITSQEEGLLFKTADVNDLAEKLKMMIDNEDYRCSVQKKAVERSKYYSVDNIINMWEEMLKSIT